MKTKEEIKAYLRKTGMYSWNGVLDDNVFGEGNEWYVAVEHLGAEDTFSGPFSTYDEADAIDRGIRKVKIWAKKD